MPDVDYLNGVPPLAIEDPVREPDQNRHTEARPLLDTDADLRMPHNPGYELLELVAKPGGDTRTGAGTIVIGNPDDIRRGSRRINRPHPRRNAANAFLTSLSEATSPRSSWASPSSMAASSLVSER